MLFIALFIADQYHDPSYLYVIGQICKKYNTYYNLFLFTNTFYTFIIIIISYFNGQMLESWIKMCLYHMSLYLASLFFNQLMGL